MRHRKRRSKLSMMTSRRNATMRNMVRDLFKYQKIQTITARAKEARRLAEKLITMAKSDTVASRRRVYVYLPDRDLIMKLFKEIVPLFKDRTSGFTRIVPLGFRRGDGASLCIFELTEKKIVEKLPKKKKEKAKQGEAKAAAAADKEAKKEVAEAEKKVREEHKKDETKIKTISKAKPTMQEEKFREQAKSEDKKLADKRGFMKNLRGLFRKRGDR